MFPVSVKGVLAAPSGEIVLLMNEREELSLDVSVGAPLDSYLFEVIPGKHVFIATYACTLLGAFNASISHEHKRLGLFRPEALPERLPDGYRASIAAWRRAASALAAPSAPSSLTAPNAPASIAGAP